MTPGVLRRFLDQPGNRAAAVSLDGTTWTFDDMLGKALAIAGLLRAGRGVAGQVVLVRGRRRGPRCPVQVPAGPVAVRAPQPGPRSRVRAVPRSGHTTTGGVRDGRGSVRGLRQPDRASRCGRTRRGRSAASAASPLSPDARPSRRLVSGRSGGHSHAHRKDGPAAPGERATASARQPAKAETRGRALARPACPAAA